MMQLRIGRDRKILIMFLVLNALFGGGNLLYASTAVGVLNMAIAALFVELLARFFEYRAPFSEPDQ